MIETVMNEINNKTASLCLMNESLKKHTTYGIGGPADLMIFPKSKQDLIKVVEIINENKIQLTILGSGSNVLVSDNGIKGAVISLKNSLKQIEVDDNILYAECGTMLGKIVKCAVKNNLIGLENLNGVPGTLGGALIMNAGAWGGEISENLIHVEVINSKSEIQKIQKKDLNFSYRQSSFNKMIYYYQQNSILKKQIKILLKKTLLRLKAVEKNLNL